MQSFHFTDCETSHIHTFMDKGDYLCQFLHSPAGFVATCQHAAYLVTISLKIHDFCRTPNKGSDTALQKHANKKTSGKKKIFTFRFLHLAYPFFLCYIFFFCRLVRSVSLRGQNIQAPQPPLPISVLESAACSSLTTLVR